MRKQRGYNMPELLIALGVIGAMTVPIFKGGEELHEIAADSRENVTEVAHLVREGVGCELRFGKPACDARKTHKQRELAAKGEGDQE
ncbi:MAG: type II secretion system GspH family protein [Rhizobium sp.]|nr:type II secretion system GspH family protein [Rhizobium sp.]